MGDRLFDLFKKIEKEGTSVSRQPISWVVAGLGNPGKEYTFTRHNAGFLATEYLAQKYGAKIDRSKFHALCGEAVIAGERVLLLQPQTYMNNSGESLREAAEFYRLPPDRVLVISDDITQAVGGLRVRRKGTDGGHNGLKSIIYHLKSDAFPRVRVGIGQKPHPDYDLAAWVLSEFSAGEKQELFGAFSDLAQGVEKILLGDVDGAMQICNSRKPKGQGTP